MSEKKPYLGDMIALSALSTKSLLSRGTTSTVSDSELSMLQNNQKAPENTTSLGELDIQKTNPKVCVAYLAARGPTAKLEY